MHIFVAAVMAFSLWLSLQGVVSGTYVIITLLVLNIFSVVLNVAVMLGADISKIDLKINETNILKQQTTNLPVMFLVRMMFLAGVWHIYTLGYALLAGAALVTVTISALSIIVLAIDRKIQE